MYHARDLAERFWEKVQQCHHGTECSQCCWLWQAGRTRGGYGTFFLKKINNKGLFKRANRMSWELTYGAIPPGMHVLHTCDNPTCVNPRHLWIGTNTENQHDSRRKGRGAIGDAVRHSGEHHPRAKLTAQQVQDIRVLGATTALTKQEIARRYDVSRRAISDIVHGKRWRYLLPE